MYVGNQKIHLNPGQFVFGRLSAGEELGMSNSTVRNWMMSLKQDSYLDIKSTNKYSVVSIKNWEEYQKQDSKKDSRIKTEKKQNNTNKNDKNEKNKKEALSVLEKYNQIRGTAYKSVNGWFGNYCKYRTTYSVEEIIKAIENTYKFKWWNETVTPTILFRTKNRGGECDNIDFLLNSRPDRSPSDYQLDLVRIQNDN